MNNKENEKEAPKDDNITFPTNDEHKSFEYILQIKNLKTKNIEKNNTKKNNN